MNYMPPYASSGMLPPTRITIPAPICTGVSLSDRFGRLQTPKTTPAPVPRVSHYGLGLPQNLPVSDNYHGPVDNRAFALSLAKRAQIQALRMKRRTINMSQRGRGSARGRAVNLPVTARLGAVRVKHPAQVMNRGTALRLARGGTRGGRGVRGGGRGGLNFVQRTGGIVGKRGTVTVRGTRGGVKSRGPGRFQRGSLANSNANNRGAGGRWKAENKSKEDLDKELESYMSKSKTYVRSNLDKELDEYMLEARTEAEAVAAAVSSAVISDNDVVMTET